MVELEKVVDGDIMVPVVAVFRSLAMVEVTLVNIINIQHQRL